MSRRGEERGVNLNDAGRAGRRFPWICRVWRFCHDGRDRRSVSAQYGSHWTLKRLAVSIGMILAVLVAIVMATPQPARAEGFTTHISLKDSTGAGIQGAKVLWWTSGSWSTLGYTDASGVLATPVPAQHYRIRIENGRGAVDTGTPVDVTNYGFNTVSVRLLNTGQLTYQGWYLGFGTFTNPMELLPGTYTIHNNESYPSSTSFSLTVGNSNVTAVLVRLLDSNGHGLAGGTVSYYISGWSSAPGSTDAQGNLVVQLPTSSPYLAMTMTYNGTSQQMNLSGLNAANFTFRTAAVNVKLIDADGNALDTGSASYYAGGWRSLGNTSNGAVAVQMLPGSYSFAMVYNGSRQQKDSIAIALPATDVVFQTGRLSLYYSESISWYSGGWHNFTKPTMEYLPGTQTFYFGPNPTCQLGIPIQSGDHLVKSVIVAKLTNSSGAPLAGGDASAYVGGWRAIGTTNALGVTCQAFDGKLGNTAVAMVYNGTRQQVSQSQPSNSIYKFSTTNVTVELRDSTGMLADTGSASYYAGAWRTIGDTNGGTASVQMLPGSYSFAMVYNGTREQKNVVAIGPAATTVTFQTVNVTVQLDDSGHNPLDGGNASYYAGSWRTIGNTAGGAVSVEMLSGNYSFAMSYLGGRSQLNGVAISNGPATVAFQTGKVISVSESATSYYASGWRPFTQGMQLLGGTYTFSFNDATPNALLTVVGGQENHIH